jgi:hypothetical protein
MVERLVAKPARMGLRPGRLPGIDAAVAEQERLQLLMRHPQGVQRRLSSPHQVSNGFMGSVRHPHRGQLSRTMQLRQAQRVTPVGLDPIARPLGYERGGHDSAAMTSLRDLAAKLVSRRSRLIAKVQLHPGLRQLPHHRRHHFRAGADVSVEPHLSASVSLSHSDRNLQLRDIQSHEKFAILSQGPPP